MNDFLIKKIKKKNLQSIVSPTRIYIIEVDVGFTFDEILAASSSHVGNLVEE